MHTGEILDRLANQQGRTEVVMSVEQALADVLLIPDNRPNHDLPRIEAWMFVWRFVWHAQEYASNEKTSLKRLFLIIEEVTR